MKEERQEKGSYLRYEGETSAKTGLHIRIIFGSWIRIHIKLKIQKL
jgi:hypothetical protein